MTGVTPLIRLNLPVYDQPGWDTLINANLQILDSLVSRAINLTGTYQGLYTPGASYSLNDTVTDPADSSLWQSNDVFTTLNTNTFAQERALNPAHWSNLALVGVNAAASAALANAQALLATAQATAAALSSTSASTSATTATTKATNASASATSAAASAASATVAVNAALDSTGRNVLHNSRFTISQRGAGPFTTTGVYTLDRWKLVLVGDTNSVTLLALSDADRTAIGDENATGALQNVFVGAATAANFSLISQPVESLRRLSGKTVTISFYAKASVALSIGVYAQQNFGTGGSPSSSVLVSPVAVPITTSWARYSLQLAIPSTSGKTLGSNGDHCTNFNFGFSSGTTNAGVIGIGAQSGTVQLWGMQVEISTTVSALETRTPAQELDLCSRFYQLGQVAYSGYGVITTNVYTSMPYPVVMRAEPTKSIVGNFSSNVGTPTFVALTPIGTGLTLQGTIAATGTYVLNVTFSASADL